MKVRELRDRLGKFDPELEVVCYSEDEGLAVKGRSVSVFLIDSIQVIEAEIGRLEDETAWPNFQGGSASQEYAFIQITSDR